MSTISDAQKHIVRFYRLMVLAFGFIGTIALTIGMLTFVETEKKLETYVEIEAVISDIEIDTGRTGNNDTTHSVTVSYCAPNGKEYETKLGYYDSSMYEGKSILIYANPDNYNEITSGKSWLGLVIGGVMGIVFIIMSIVMAKAFNIGSTKNWTEVSAEIVRWEQAPVRINNRSTHYAICAGNDETGMSREFRSSPIPITREELVSEIGRPVTVYIKPGNSKRYRVKFDQEA